MMKKISVIIPVYNKKEYLEKCIKSVLESSLDDIELICVDDCSADGSYELMMSIKEADSRVLVYRNNSNKGVSYTRNVGIDKATGKYMCFLDADDYLEADALNTWYDRLEEGDAQGCFISIDSEKAVGIKNTYEGCYTGKEILDRFTCNNEMFLYACGVIWETAFIKEHKVLFRNLRVGEGGLFILEALLKAERIVCSDYKGYHYVVNPSSTSFGDKAMTYASIGQAKQIADMILNLRQDTDDKEILHFVRWYLNKNIGGIQNLKKADLIENWDSFSDNERLILDLIRDDNLTGSLMISGEDIEMLKIKHQVYLYGAGYDVLQALKICNDHDVEIKGIYVSVGASHPNTVYGYRVLEFSQDMPLDKDIPFMVTAHKKHHADIKKNLISASVKNMIFVGGDY